MIECLPTCQSAERPAKYPPITAGDYMVEKFASQASGEDDEDSRKFGTADTESRFTAGGHASAATADWFTESGSNAVRP